MFTYSKFSVHMYTKHATDCEKIDLKYIDIKTSPSLSSCEYLVLSI